MDDGLIARRDAGIRRLSVRLFVALLVGGLACWLLLLLALLGLERYEGDLGCRLPGTDSEYGDASWQWLPLGTVCTDTRTGQPFNEPSWAFVANVVGGAVVMVVVVGLWVRYERRTGSALRTLEDGAPMTGP
jgi:hypothetical protein